MLKPTFALVLALLATPAFANNSNGTDEYSRNCGNVLELLPRIVRKAEVAAIPPDAHVVLHGICRGVQMTTFGNAGGLRATIQQNRALSAALRRGGWRSDDVVGIQMAGTDTVHLYVHRN